MPFVYGNKDGIGPRELPNIAKKNVNSTFTLGFYWMINLDRGL